MRQATRDLLAAAGLPAAYVRDLAARTLAEDLGGPDGVDVTAVATIPAAQRGTGELIARADGVLAGLAVAAAVFDLASDGELEFTPLAEDGARVRRDDVLATITGPLRALLTAERNALNLLCRVSGVATHTRRWADELDGTGTTVLDTRKTTPGLRLLEKYAVRCGGGTNKRMGLYDVAMIKDNHKIAAGSITAALFLRRFVERAKAWAHFDVYAWNPKTLPARPEGGEIQVARLLFSMLAHGYVTQPRYI